MSEESSPIFVELTDEEGNTQTLEYIMSLEIDGQEYRAFFPTEAEGEDDDPDAGLIILKVINEGGEELLSTCDSEEELLRAYDQFALELFEDDEEENP